jgi:hypothetical protein
VTGRLSAIPDLPGSIAGVRPFKVAVASSGAIDRRSSSARTYLLMRPTSTFTRNDRRWPGRAFKTCCTAQSTSARAPSACGLTLQRLP